MYTYDFTDEEVASALYIPSPLPYLKLFISIYFIVPLI